MSQVCSIDVLKKEKLGNSKGTDWWSAAGICEKPRIPKWCISDTDQTCTVQSKIPLWEVHYHLSHQLLRDVDAFFNGVAQPVASGGITSRLYADFLASCRSVEKRILEPFPGRLDLQGRSGSFVPHHCLRQLALIEIAHKTLKDIPREILLWMRVSRSMQTVFNLRVTLQQVFLRPTRMSGVMKLV